MDKMYHLMAEKQQYYKKDSHQGQVTPKKKEFYSVFHQFRQAKFAYGGSISGSSKFFILP
jgi:hypothetical protein